MAFLNVPLKSSKSKTWKYPNRRFNLTLKYKGKIQQVLMEALVLGSESMIHNKQPNNPMVTQLYFASAKLD